MAIWVVQWPDITTAAAGGALSLGLPHGAVSGSTASTTLDFATYQGITLTLVSSQATALTLTNPGATVGTACRLIIKQPASGMITPTWTTKPYALSGAITIATTASSVTLIGLIWDGSAWYASVSQPMSIIP